MNSRLKVCLLLLVVGVNAFGSECFVAGLAVDRNGKAVPSARVIAYSPPTGWEDLIVSYTSDERGEFSIPYPCRSTKAKLFVAPSLDFQKDYIPVAPPVSISPEVAPRLAGLKLPSIRTGTFKVGKVVVPEYRQVRVKFVDENSVAFLPSELPGGLWLRISLDGGQRLFWGSISTHDWKVATSETPSTLAMILPEGKWSIEVGFSEDKDPYFYPDKLVEIRPENVGRVEEIILRMAKNKIGF